MQATPELDYPIAARARHITGHGVFDIWFHIETGVATRVNILRSTGSKLLDDAIVKGFYRWRAKPKTVRHMQVPVSFVM
jgi:TonB family protein